LSAQSSDTDGKNEADKIKGTRSQGKMKIRLYAPSDKKGLIALWKSCGLVNPKNDPTKDIQRKLRSKNGWIIVGEEKGEVIASVMAGYEGHRGWLNYLAVSPGRQKEGIGRKIVGHAEGKLKKLGCPKINLQVRKGNGAVLDFYRRIGYREDEVVSLGKRLVDDSGREGKPK
jgi:ribosomal protein S18 acetylase RimI-like enzyme